MSDLELEIEGAAEPRQTLRTLLTPEQLADAESAIQNASPGKSLSQVVAHYESLRKQAEEKGANLDQALRFFLAHFREEIREVTVLNAVTEFLKKRLDIADTTRANYDQALKLLLKPDPNKLLHTVTVSDLEEILDCYPKPQTRRSYRIIFAVFLNWAVQHHYILENPCDRLNKIPREMSRISVLSLEESKRLLSAAMQLQGGVAASSIAIGLFAGLRPSEIRDLKPENILAHKIRVEGGKMRRKLKRSVPIPPVLAAWLKEYPFKGLPKGWNYKMKKFRKATKAQSWVQDITRHTSISFQTERDENEGLTAKNCGTSITMMDLHYRDVIDDPAIIEEFWGLTPEKILKERIEVDVPVRERVNWPSKANLKKLVWRKPLLHAAKDIGVSDVALKKHCLKIAIELPPRGHWLKR